MTRAWLLALALGAIAPWSAALCQTLEPDLSLPGAEARLGWGGGFQSGAWSELHLWVTGSDEYQLTLESNDGTLRSGLHPLSAKLEVPAGAGVREATLMIPLFIKRPVTLTLTGPLGHRSLKLEPFPEAPTVSDPASTPAAYIGGVKLSGAFEPTAALVALAGGAVVPASADLQKLPSGALGLGVLRRHNETLAPVPLTRLVENLEPKIQPPPRRSEGLALWCVAAFIGVLGLYSARRLDWRFSAAGALLATLIGTIGLIALQPRTAFAERSQRVQIGAGGWGLEFTVRARFSPRGGPQALPISAQTIDPIERQYTASTTLVKARPWSHFSYWTMPTAARVPLRVSKNWIENSGDGRISDLYIVGYGNLEPLGTARRAIGAVANSLPPSEYDSFVRMLPDGSAIARMNDTLLIALPESP